MTHLCFTRRASIVTLALASLMAAPFAAGAANIVIQSRDPAGVGFNDTTPVAPVGGNSGTTLGQQRWNVYRHVADIWEKQLKSDIDIVVSAGWEALSCNETGAVLGSAGAWNIWSDFPGGRPGTWYPQALANKLAGVNLAADQPDDGSGYGNVDIKTQFNINLGEKGCLTGTSFYLGLDGNAGSKINFMTTLLHELGHGLGFSSLTVSASTGSRFLNLPSVWESFMYDNTARKTWLAMTNAERKASAVNPLKLAWIGPNASAGAKETLGATPLLKISTPVPGAAGEYAIGTASFGPAIGSPAVTGTIGVAAGDGCTAFTSADRAKINGKLAVVDRGGCTFVIKVKAAQEAGAIGVLIADNDPLNSPEAPPGMSGDDDTITIPAVRISQPAGVKLKQAVIDAAKYGSRSQPGTVVAKLFADESRLAGADPYGRPLLYTPSVLSPGSSVSHWDVSATPNLLMEPNINSDLTTMLVPPKDLTVPLLKDIGW